jgi:hypothetical protein
MRVQSLKSDWTSAQASRLTILFSNEMKMLANSRDALTVGFRFIHLGSTMIFVSLLSRWSKPLHVSATKLFVISAFLLDGSLYTDPYVRQSSNLQLLFHFN